MIDHKLNNVDSEDIEDLLLKVEKSFDIKFADFELANVTTFGELCDHIANKIELENFEDCTTQQAFYKLRQSISVSLYFNVSELTPATSVTHILPRPNRIAKVKKLEEHLGFKLNILRPKHSISGTLILSLLASLVALFFQWKVGVLGLAISIFGLWLAGKMGKETDLTNLGEIVEKMTRENYLKSRSNPRTFNKKEVEKVLMDLFSLEFDFEKVELTRDAKLF
ncbi:acyl carrier protein [Flavihumibacter sp. R14]|nr:acyl carrier protein [Flavihumibacter soli]